MTFENVLGEALEDESKEPLPGGKEGLLGVGLKVILTLVTKSPLLQHHHCYNLPSNLVTGPMS